MTRTVYRKKLKCGVAYCRIADTSAGGYLLDRQEQLINRRAKEDGVTLKHIIKATGRRLDIKSIEFLLTNNSDVDTLYVSSRDRVTRSYNEWLSFLEAFKKMSVRLVVVNSECDDPDKLIIDSIERHMATEMYQFRREHSLKRKRTC